MSPLLDYAGLAEVLGITESWLRRHIRELPHEKYGRAVRFSAENVAEIRNIYSVQPETKLSTVVVQVGPVPLGARPAA
ncbi:helix-turn-helix domain-containing protein [Streptomyces rubellomurinus]|uniref:DNA-binding protein n=1 Tax=Streptomyces rubellomurinus (strain ATCC 31215) TaxID=359131 RepID=A0A0F2TDU3_STRR3|nr:helix-turn-helix domain-containing protein [Streptomyces rubellomurinus]KJS60671.1 hypothetical protein VM95_19860 [Streptomyces rubellomurinus]